MLLADSFMLSPVGSERSPVAVALVPLICIWDGAPLLPVVQYPCALQCHRTLLRTITEHNVVVVVVVSKHAPYRFLLLGCRFKNYSGVVTGGATLTDASCKRTEIRVLNYFQSRSVSPVAPS